MIMVAVITIILYVVPFRMPMVVTVSLGLIGDCMMPVSMLLIGAEIASMNVKEILCDRDSYIVSLFRMLIIPFVMYILMVSLKIEHQAASTIIILSAMPSATLNVIMGQKYDNNPKFAACAIMQNTLIMLVTLPLFVWICSK